MISGSQMLKVGTWSFRRRLFLIRSAFESSFAAHIEMFHENLVGLAIGCDGKGNAASASSVLVLCLVGECVAVVMLHREGLVRRTLHDR